MERVFGRLKGYRKLDALRTREAAEGVATRGDERAGDEWQRSGEGLGGQVERA